MIYIMNGPQCGEAPSDMDSTIERGGRVDQRGVRMKSRIEIYEIHPLSREMACAEIDGMTDGGLHNHAGRSARPRRKSLSLACKPLVLQGETRS